MEDNQTQIVPPGEPVPVSKLVEVKRNIPLLYGVIGILILLLLITTIFLAYQNIQLRKEIITMKITQVVGTPVPSGSPDPTADWKTFADSNGTFIFKYPSDYTASTDIGLLNDPTNKFAFSVGVFKSNLSVEEWAKQNRCTGNTCSSFTTGIWPGSIQFDLTGQYASVESVVKYGDAIYELSMNSKEANKPVDATVKGIYNQILGTFKYLTPTTTTGS